MNNKPQKNVNIIAVVAVLLGFFLWLGWYFTQLQSPEAEQIEQQNREWEERLKIDEIK